MLLKKAGFRVVLCGVGLLCADTFFKSFVQSNLVEMYGFSRFYPYGGIGVFHKVAGVDLCIHCLYNTGGAWGILYSHPIILFYVRLIVIAILTIYTIFFNPRRDYDYPLMLILVGSISNIIDVLAYGAVIDFIHLTIWGLSLPVFNLSDMMIFFGVLTIMIRHLNFSRKKGQVRG